MAPSADQLALLTLILERGFDYEAIAEVTGDGPAESRTRAAAALRALDPSDEELDGDLADYLLGAGGAGERAGVERRLSEDGSANEQARRLSDAIRAHFEGVEPLPISDPRTRDREDAARRRRGTLAVAALAAVIALAAVLVAVLGGDEGKSETAQAPAPAASSSVKPVRIALSGPHGADGSAIVGMTENQRPYLDLSLAGAATGSKREVLMLWVDFGHGRGLPLPPPIVPSSSGGFRDRIDLEPELLAVLGRGASLEVVRARQSEISRLSDEITSAVASGDAGSGPNALPRRPGPVMLSGAIPTS